MKLLILDHCALQDNSDKQSRTTNAKRLLRHDVLTEILDVEKKLRNVQAFLKGGLILEGNFTLVPSSKIVQNHYSKSFHIKYIVQRNGKKLMIQGSFTNYVYKTRYIGRWSTSVPQKMSTQGGRWSKKPKSCQRSL